MTDSLTDKQKNRHSDRQKKLATQSEPLRYSVEPPSLLPSFWVQPQNVGNEYLMCFAPILNSKHGNKKNEVLYD